jgi:hypothetical protein
MPDSIEKNRAEAVNLTLRDHRPMKEGRINPVMGSPYHGFPILGRRYRQTLSTRYRQPLSTDAPDSICSNFER